MGLISSQAALISNIGMGLDARAQVMQNNSALTGALGRKFPTLEAAAEFEKNIVQSNLTASLKSAIADARKEGLMKQRDEAIKNGFGANLYTNA